MPSQAQKTLGFRLWGRGRTKRETSYYSLLSNQVHRGWKKQNGLEVLVEFILGEAVWTLLDSGSRPLRAF